MRPYDYPRDLVGSINPQEPASEPLVETHHPCVGRGGRDKHRRARPVATRGKGLVHEHPAHPGALAILTDCQALDLRLVQADTIDELEMADHDGSVSGHEHTPEIPVTQDGRR